MVYLKLAMLGFGMDKQTYGDGDEFMKKIQQEIIALNFDEAYEKLKLISYNFDFNNLSKDFPKIKSDTMYIFLMFAIVKEETINKHLAICNYLYFMEPYINGADTLIKYHLKRILEISPNNPIVLNEWIFGVYLGNPDCPFSEKELNAYKAINSIVENKSD